MKKQITDIDLAFIYISSLAKKRKDFVIKVGLNLDRDEEYLELNKVLVVLNRISRKDLLKEE